MNLIIRSIVKITKTVLLVNPCNPNTVGSFNNIFKNLKFIITNNMSANANPSNTLERLEKNAWVAENLIAEIYKKIQDIEKKQTNSSTQNAEVEQLRSENADLKAEIAKWKETLTIRQIRNGKPYVPAPKIVKSTKVVENVGAAIGSASAPAPAATKSTKVDLKGSAGPPQVPGKDKDDSGLKKSGETKKPTKGKDKEKSEPAGSASAPNSDEVVDVSRLDFRIGKIIEVEKHPDADSLYVEKIDVGEPTPRTVVSGLVKHVPIEEMKNRMVVVLCNLKPAKMRGVLSEAMVMCASTPEKVEILVPPPNSVPGDLVNFDGFSRKPDPVLNPKKKIFETVAPDLKTTADKIASYKGIPFKVVGKGNIVTATLANVIIK